MKLDVSDIDDLRPVIAAAVQATLAELAHQEARLTVDRLGFTEPEAAALLGVQRHVLRDARLRGEISAAKIGKRMIYERAELLRFLRDSRA